MRKQGRKKDSGSGVGVQHNKTGEMKTDSGNLSLMEEVVADGNIREAIKRVKKNKGAPGVDSMSVDEVEAHLSRHWDSIKDKLLVGMYIPAPILRVEIPKPGKKEKRKLGIPTVQDRVIQQAILQVIQGLFDPDFSDNSFGFRPKRSAHDALARAKKHVQAGYNWVVDIDLEKFFDRVNHDMLMSRVARKVKDKTLLKTIRRYLKAGIMEHGVVVTNDEGTPQGGSLSPLLSNILLDDLDKELERRGHRFVRYADDCNIYVRSEKSSGRVLESVSHFLEKKLKLKVNRQKSSHGPSSQSSFLGFHIYLEENMVKIGICPNRLKFFRQKLKILLKRGRGSNIQWFVEYKLKAVLRGWLNYFRLCEEEAPFRKLDAWLRHRIRLLYWRQWKRARTRFRKLIKLGLRIKKPAWFKLRSLGPWRASQHVRVNNAMNLAFFDKLGLYSLLKKWKEYRMVQ
jgi:group II intron reverse transcriptase/maturase